MKETKKSYVVTASLEVDAYDAEHAKEVFKNEIYYDISSTKQRIEVSEMSTPAYPLTSPELGVGDLATTRLPNSPVFLLTREAKSEDTVRSFHTLHFDPLTLEPRTHVFSSNILLPYPNTSNKENK